MNPRINLPGYKCFLALEWKGILVLEGRWYNTLRLHFKELKNIKEFILIIIYYSDFTILFYITKYIYIYDKCIFETLKESSEMFCAL